MKKLIIYILFFITLCAYIQAQSVKTDNVDSSRTLTSGGRLTGPRAKNKKAWGNRHVGRQVMIPISEKELKGPKAKNKKPFSKKWKTSYQGVVTNTPKKGLKGPKAKNYRHPRN